MLIALLPVIIIFLAGYAVGRIFSKIVSGGERGLFVTLLEGNIILSFTFVTLFIFLGVLTNNALIFFYIYGLFLLILISIDFFYLIKHLEERIKLSTSRAADSKKWFRKNLFENRENFPFISLIVVITLLIAFNYILISYHSIYNEYDSLYIFLPISQSIILGNGLNIDYFGGSDNSIRYPPFVQALNAWLLSEFDYQVLRSFPIYFVLLTTLSIYFITKRLTNERFLPLVAASFYLLVPATLVISSRFSLQHDIPFISFLSFSALSFCNVLYSTKIKKYDFVTFIIAISLLPLTREIGLIISWSLLLVLIAFKFSNNNLVFKIILIFFSFLPVFGLTFYDIADAGFTNTTLVRLFSLLLCSIAIVILSLKFKESLTMRSIYQFLPYLIIIIVPSIFIVVNLIQMNGPYPTLMFSADFNNSIPEYREIFDVSNRLDQPVFESILQFPRIDLIFFSTALGGALILFKISGFVRIFRNLRKKFDHRSFILIFFIILLLVWSYFLNSNFMESGIRHISYFVPFLSIIAVLSLRSQTNLAKLYYLIVITVLIYYIINFEIEFTYLQNHFNAVWIDPFVSETITLNSLLIGILLFFGYFILLELEKRFPSKVSRMQQSKWINLGFASCCIIIVLILVSVDLGYSFSDLVIGEGIDSTPPQWENNVTEVIRFLQNSEDGNVLGIRTPSISFLTNRTNYDAFNPHTFGKVVLPILNATNTDFEKKINEFNIKYIIIPSENNPQYNIVQNMNDKYNFTATLIQHEDFLKVGLPSYDIFKHVKPDSFYIDMLEKSFAWTPFNVELVRSNSSLLILSEADDNDLIFNRAFLNTNFLQESPLLLHLNYTTEILKGDASFFLEARNSISNEILYSYELANTKGSKIEETIILPESVSNNEIQIRFYVIPNESGMAYLLIDNALLYRA